MALASLYIKGKENYKLLERKTHLYLSFYYYFILNICPWQCPCVPPQYEFSPQTLCCYGKQLCTISRDGTYYSYQNRYLHAELYENNWIQHRCTRKAVFHHYYIAIPRLLYLQKVVVNWNTLFLHTPMSHNIKSHLLVPLCHQNSFDT